MTRSDTIEERTRRQKQMNGLPMAITLFFVVLYEVMAL
jgi:hypothetical protein